MHRSARYFGVGVSLLTLSLLWSFTGNSHAQTQTRVVRIAELEIDPAQLGSYTTALKEEIEASIRVEPGVLTLYAVAVRGNPAQIRLFEIYADSAAYNAHLASPHFRKYKAATEGMVKALRLVETDPILLGSKGK